jgi:hypothetical protein
MSVNISARVDKETKRRMDQLTEVNWSREIRNFIHSRVKQEERKKVVARLSERLSRMPKTERGFSSKSIREDRDL